MTLKYIRVYGFGGSVPFAGINCLRCTQFAILYQKREGIRVYARCMRDDAHVATHTRISVHFVLGCPWIVLVSLQCLPSIGSLLGDVRLVLATIVASEAPQATENSLKILDIYSYNLHVIIHERRMYVARCSLKVQINVGEFLSRGKYTHVSATRLLLV